MLLLIHRQTQMDRSRPDSHLAKLQVRDGTGVYKGLGDDREAGVHVIRLVYVKYKLRILQYVHPES